MIANVKIKVVLIEGSRETRLNSAPGKQIKKGGQITASDIKSLMSTDLFEADVYRKVKEEVWGSSDRAQLADDVIVHKMPNLTYIVYVEKK